MALKMFITDQLYLLKQSVGNPKTPECYCNSKSDSYIKYLIEQIHYLKEENKMKNSFIQSLLFQNSSTTVPNVLFRIMIKLMIPLQLLIMTTFLMILKIQRMRILTMRITT